jgi:hypothetical protein
MSTIKLVGGAAASWTSLMTTELNSLASGNAVIGSTAIDNGTNLDLVAEFSFIGGGSITTTGTPFLGLFLYPKNGDATTFGDNRFGSSAAGPPPSNYYRGYCGLPPAGAATQYGTFALPGTGVTRIPLPMGIWKPVLYSLAGVALTSSGNILYYRTTNLSVA